MPIVVQCGSCQKQFQAGDHLAGKQVKCPGCQTPLVIPAPQQTPAESAFGDLLNDEVPDRNPNAVAGQAETKCPGCGVIVNPEAVLCVDCGYNLVKGKKIVPDTPSDRKARYEARADAMANRGVERKTKKKS